MEKIICKACLASIEKNLEFCSSCGEWLGLKIEDMEEKDPTIKNRSVRNRVPQIKCPNCRILNLPSIKNC